MNASYAELDQAFSLLAGYGPSLNDGLFNHAPMVAEALCVLGEGNKVQPWIYARRASFAPRPPGVAPIGEAGWHEALGQHQRFADWASFLRREIALSGWQPTLETWVARLAPGFTSAACHGVLRTAHAARALSAGESPQRTDELADALAAWAANYQELPVPAYGATGTLSADAALDALSPLPEANRPGPGLITAGFQALRFHARFAEEAARVDLRGDPQDRLDELLSSFARLFVATARNPFSAIVFTHAVTGVAAVGNLRPLISKATAAELTFRAWEAGCALKVAFDAGRGQPAAAGERVGHDPDRLAGAAATHGDDHVIKLTEACLSAYERNPLPNLLVAAELIQRVIPRA